MKTVFLLMTILGVAATLTSPRPVPENLTVWRADSLQVSATPRTVPLQENKIAFVSNEQLYIMNTDGSDAVGLTENGVPIHGTHPTWSPDGKQIAFERDTDDFLKAEIWVCNVDGSDAHPLSQSGRAPAWSSDGIYIAFSSRREGFPNVYIVHQDGSNLVRLTGTQGGFAPAWSPDSQRIIFSAVYNGHIEAFIMNRDGSSVRRITTNASAATDYDGQFSWSPDGRKIAFKSARTGRPQIYVMDADGSNIVRLTNTLSGNFYPAWSPDGRSIAFSSGRGGPSTTPGTDGIPVSDLYVMNADGTNPIRLTTSALGNFAPAWKP
jgi:Tol biopolymer transport system component